MAAAPAAAPVGAPADEKGTVLEGYLTKSPPIKTVNEKGFSRWKRRWFVLTPTELTYHVNSDQRNEIKGAVDLTTTMRIKTTVPAQNHKYVFSIKYTTMEGSEREMFIAASSLAERDKWVAALIDVATKAATSEVVILPKRRRSSVEAAEAAASTAGGADVQADAAVADAVATDDAEEVVHAGVLRKSPAKIGAVDQRAKWRARWFVLSGSKLQYFTDVDEDVLRGVIDLADVLRIQPKVLSVKYDYVFALHCQKSDENIRSYFLACDRDSEREEWVEALKPEIEAATAKAAVVDKSTDMESTGAEETPVDLIDPAEFWPIVSKKLGQDLLDKDGAGIKEMMLNDDQELAATPAELEDLFVELLGADAVKDGAVTISPEDGPVKMEGLFQKMDSTRSGVVMVQGFLEVVSPATAAELDKSKRQVQRHMRASFSQKVRKPGAADAEVSAEDAIFEADEAVDLSDMLPPANEYSDDEEDSGDEWYDGLFEDVPDDDKADADEEGADADDGLDPSAMAAGEDDSVDVDEAADAEDENADDDEDEDDDDDDDDDDGIDVEDLIDEADSYDMLTAYDSELVEYSSIPPRVYPTVTLTKTFYGREPTTCRDGDLWTYLTALVKERNAYLRMGARKREKPAGRNRRRRIIMMQENVVEAFGKLEDQLNCVEKSRGFTLLHIVCRKPKVTKDLVGLLLEMGADCNVPDNVGRTPMHLAASAGHSKCVKRLLAAGGNPNLVSDKGLMPLLQSFKLARTQRFQRGKIKVAEAIVRSGRCNIDVGGDPEGKKPGAAPLIRLLHKGSKSSRAARIVEPFIHLLLSHGANPNVRHPGKKSTSALWMALNQLKSGKISRAVDCMLRENSVEMAIPVAAETFNERDANSKSELTPFFLCCLYRQDNALRHLFKLEADGREESYTIPKLKGCPKLPPLCNAFEAAAYSGCATTIKMFLQNDESGERRKALLSPPVGWDEAWKGIDNVPLIVIGITRANPLEAEVFAGLILEYTVDVNTPHMDGMNIAMLFAAIGHTGALMMLLNHGELEVDLSAVDVYNRNIVFYAAYGCVANRTAALSALLSRGGDPLVADRAGVTPLLAAARNGDEQSVMVLMNQKFTPRDRRVENPDWVPPKKKKTEKKEKGSLIERAKKLQRDSKIAAAGDDKGKAQSTSRMIPRIARDVIINVAEGDERGWAHLPHPPYSPGAYKGVTGDELNRKDALGYTALWYAVLWGNTDMVRMLIADPAVDVNVQNRAGIGGNDMTPLMLAACVRARGKLDIFFELLKHPKIDLDLKNVRGHTVFDIAALEEIEFVLRPMTDVLKKRGCKLSKDLNNLEKFESASSVTWKDPTKKHTTAAAASGMAAGIAAAATKDIPGMGGMLLSGPEANSIWDGLLTAEPFYGDTLWLRKQVAYDLVTKQVLRKEWVRQKKDQAKYGSLKATLHSASILHMIKIGGSMASAMKHAAKFALMTWMVYKSCGTRRYDVEYYNAQQLFPELELREVKVDLEYIERVHIPEDFGMKRYHVGRYMRHSTAKADKPAVEKLTQDGAIHPERWIRKKRPKSIESWA